MNVTGFLGRLFNIRSGEGHRLALLYTMSLVTLTGTNWGESIVQAAFLQRVGVQYLPWVFISSAACSVLSLFIYSAFADRVSNTHLLIAILAVSGAGIVLGLAGLAFGWVGPAYLLLYLVLNAPLMDAYNVHWATYVNSFYDTQASKRIVPLLGTSARLAGIIAGLSMPLLNHLLTPAAIIAVWLASLVIMAALAVAMPRLLREQQPVPSPSTAGAAQPPVARQGGFKGFASAYGANLREGYQQITRSPFLGWMALSTLTMTILLALLNFQASAIFLEQLKTTAQISSFLGVLSGVANLVILPIQLFLLSRLITRLGLGNISLVYPLASLAAASSLVILPSLITASLAYLDRTALRTAFRSPIENLLYNAVPLRVKARTRAFVGGMIIPIGAILGGLLLLTPVMRAPWVLRISIIVLGLVFTLCALMVRRTYTGALLALLEQEDYSSLALQDPGLQEPSVLPTVEPATLALLAQKLRESTSPERTIFMAQLLSQIGGEAAVPIVDQAIHTAGEGRLRAALVNVLVAADVRRGGVRTLYTGLLSDRDGQVRLAAISGLEQLDGPRDARFLQTAASSLVDPEIEVRLRVLPALLASDDPGYWVKGTRALRALLNAPDPQTQVRALQVVGQTHEFSYLPEVVGALTDAPDEVRLAASLAAEQLAGSELPAGSRDILLVSVLPLLQDPIERARRSAVTILGQAGTGSKVATLTAHEGLAAALADPSLQVREQAVEALAHAGRRAIPAVREQLDAADPHLRKMAAVALARIDPRQYAPLLRDAYLDDSLLAIYQNLHCQHAFNGCATPAAAVLQRALRERSASLVNEFFYLLAATQDQAAVHTIAHSLRSPEPATRANAAEAFEALTGTRMAALVTPLFQPDISFEQLLSLARQTWNFPAPTPAAALRMLLTGPGNTWLRALAAAALVELGTSPTFLAPAEATALLDQARADPEASVRAEVSAVAASDIGAAPQTKALSLVQKLILLKEVPFSQGMTVDQLTILAGVCEEEFFPENTRLYNAGDPGGILYIVVSGQVGIEQEKRKRSFVRLATIEAHSYLGETDFFDASPRITSAVAIQDTFALRLRREPLIALARQHPDLSLELINVLSARLRTANDQIAELTRTRSREMHKLFDQLS